KEAIMTLRIEQKYTKDQILKIYFNEIPYGSSNYGVESAAESYFGKNASELDLAESATLAGLPKAPSTYLNDHTALKQRRNFVLSRMYNEGYITEEEEKVAQAEELSIKQSFNNIEAPHFVLYVKQQLVEKYGETMVDTGGLKVITTLDWDKQKIAQKIMDDEADAILNSAGADNTSLVSIDP
ncbi:MAG: penicillin-binding protein, partial [Candidatus Magasanikbacteria bacterium CG10_big_fil_rev_8_21_14_0_10_36_16]